MEWSALLLLFLLMACPILFFKWLNQFSNWLGDHVKRLFKGKE